MVKFSNIIKKVISYLTMSVIMLAWNGTYWISQAVQLFERDRDE